MDELGQCVRGEYPVALVPAIGEIQVSTVLDEVEDGASALDADPDRAIARATDVAGIEIRLVLPQASHEVDAARLVDCVMSAHAKSHELPTTGLADDEIEHRHGRHALASAQRSGDHGRR